MSNQTTNFQTAAQLMEQAEAIRYLAGYADNVQDMQAEIAKAVELEIRAIALDNAGKTAIGLEHDQ